MWVCDLGIVIMVSVNGSYYDVYLLVVEDIVVLFGMR